MTSSIIVLLVIIILGSSPLLRYSSLFLCQENVGIGTPLALHDKLILPPAKCIVSTGLLTISTGTIIETHH